MALVSRTVHRMAQNQGTGKTAHCTALASEVPQLKYTNIGDIVKEKSLHSGWNEEWQSYDVDEDKLLDELEPIAGGSKEGGVLLDWHVNEIFPERWIDLVVILRCDHTKLWQRLEQRCALHPFFFLQWPRMASCSSICVNRGYPLNKIQENNEAEIMQTVLDEARASYAPEIVVELTSETPEDIESNVERIKLWIQNWKQDQTEDED